MSIFNDKSFKNTPANNAKEQDVGVDVLFKNSSGVENLNYSRPPQNTSSVMAENRTRLKEEVLPPLSSSTKEDLQVEQLFGASVETLDASNAPHLAPSNQNEDVFAEVLYRSGVENLEIVKEAKLREESIAFSEPVKPNSINEEALFAGEGEGINYSLFDTQVKEKTEQAEQEPSTEQLAETSDYQMSFGDLTDIASVVEPTAVKKVVIKKKFVEKMLDADPVLLENYNTIKNFMLSYKKVKSRISNTCDTFNIGRTQLIKMAATGKSLKLYLNLDFNKVETRLKCKDASHKRSYEQVPVFLRIRSPRSMRNALYLLNQLVEKHGLVINPKAVKVDAIAILKERLKND